MVFIHLYLMQRLVLKLILILSSKVFLTWLNIYQERYRLLFFAPFPNDWFSEGKETGRIGKLLAGLEMLVWYAILIGFIYVVFNNFSMLKPLIPMLILSAIIITLLGYVVPNVGAIFRMRQGFMIPFFIFGCYGLYLMIYQKVVKSE